MQFKYLDLNKPSRTACMYNQRGDQPFEFNQVKCYNSNVYLYKWHQDQNTICFLAKGQNRQLMYPILHNLNYLWLYYKSFHHRRDFHNMRIIRVCQLKKIQLRNSSQSSTLHQQAKIQSFNMEKYQYNYECIRNRIPQLIGLDSVILDHRLSLRYQHALVFLLEDRANKTNQ